MIAPSLFSFLLFFISFLFAYSCGYLEFCLCGWSILRRNLGFVEQSWLRRLCMSFVYSCILLLVVFLVLCILVVGGVAYICVAFYLIGWGCVLDLCVSSYIFVSCLVFFILYFLYFCSWLWPLSSQWRHDLGVGGSHIPFLHVFLWKVLPNFLSFV